MAVAHKNELACFALCPEEADQDDERRSSHALCSCSDAITDMVWVAFTAGGEGTCGSAAATPGSPSPPGAAAGADMCLLVGTAGGHLQIHSATGKLLLRQRLHASAVRRIRVSAVTASLMHCRSAASTGHALPRQRPA